MFLKLKKGLLRKIINRALEKAGNIDKLEQKVKIPRSTLSAYRNEKRIIRKEAFVKITNYVRYVVKNRDVVKELPSNWRQIKGGRAVVKERRKKGTFQKHLKLLHEKSSLHMRKWHRKMKTTDPIRYHLTQYTRFKKAGEYKYLTLNGEKVRNTLEKEVADILCTLKIPYEYEPLVHAKNKYFFPDFLIGNKIIIECTMWRGQDKAIKLQDKIRHLKEKYRVYVVIPKALNKYYKTLGKHLVLGLDDFVPVAQTILGFRSEDRSNR